MKHRLIELMGEKQEREGRFITAAVVAEEAGVHPNTVKNWLDGKISRPDEHVVIKLCRYFGVDMPQLLYIDWQGDPPQRIEA